MWVKFTKNYPFKPKPTVTVPYRVGMRANLPKGVAEAMIAKGVAEEIPETNRPRQRATASAAK